MYDFSTTEPAKASNYLRPGVHTVKIVNVEAGKFEKSDIPYLGITFEDSDGTQLTEKFVLKTKNEDSKTNPLARLQYLHEAWTGKLLDKAFKNVSEIEAYFKKVFVNPKAGSRNLIVGGEINGKVVYGKVPYTGFIVSDDDLEVGEFEEGSDEWKKYVKKSTRTTEASGKKGGLLNDDDDDDDLGGDDDDSFEAPKKKTELVSKKAATAKAKKPVTADVDEDADDDDDIW